MALEDIAGEVVDDDDLGVELGVDLHGSPKSHSVVTHCHFFCLGLSIYSTGRIYGGYPAIISGVAYERPKKTKKKEIRTLTPLFHRSQNVVTPKSKPMPKKNALAKTVPTKTPGDDQRGQGEGEREADCCA